MYASQWWNEGVQAVAAEAARASSHRLPKDLGTG